MGGRAESASVLLQTLEEYNKWLLSGILIYFSIQPDGFRIVLRRTCRPPLISFFLFSGLKLDFSQKKLQKATEKNVLFRGFLLHQV